MIEDKALDLGTATIQAVAPSGGYVIIAMVLVVTLAALLSGVVYYVFAKMIPIFEGINRNLELLADRERAFTSTITYERDTSKQCFEKLVGKMGSIEKEVVALRNILELNALEIKSRLEK